MLKKVLHNVRHFFRPPPSEASRLDSHTALAGLFIEACYRDGGMTGKERMLVDEALVQHLAIEPAEASALRVKAEEVQWTSMTPIGFAAAASKGLSEPTREAVIQSMIGFIEYDRQVEAMENRLILTTANCFGISSSRVKELRKAMQEQKK